MKRYLSLLRKINETVLILLSLLNYIIFKIDLMILQI